MYLPSSPAGMVDVIHSECYKLITMLWNLHIIICIYSAVRSKLEVVRVDVSCTCAVCTDIIP